MTTYNTGNPIGSTDPRDLYDNSEVFDELINNTTDATVNDRFGNPRITLANQLGYRGTGVDNAIEDYSAGIEMTSYNTIIRYSGEFYRPSASATLPYTTTATLPDADSNLAPVGDAVLRQELAGDPASGFGAALVNGSVIRVGSVADIEALVPSDGWQASLVGVNSAIFEFSSSDLSTEVASDPTQHIYIAPSYSPTGVDGAWISKSPKEFRAIKSSSSNIIQNPTFIRGWDQWGQRINFSGKNGVNLRYVSDPTGSYFGQIHAQIARDVAGEAALVSTPLSPVDPSKPYRVGFWGWNSLAGASANVVIHCVRVGGEVGTLTLPFTVVGTGQLDSQTGEEISVINAAGGAAPAWPADTQAVMVEVENVENDTSLRLLDLFLIPVEKWPGDSVTKTNSGSFGGTHEAVTDGTHLYVCTHAVNQVAKFDLNMVRLATADTPTRPHDVALAAGSLWCIANGTAQLYEIDPNTMAVLNTYATANLGFDVEEFNGRLFVSTGVGVAGEIYEVDTATGAQTLVTQDVNGGAANLPIVFLASSMWSINSENSATSEVKRINPDTGSTLATITAGVGKIYGIGVGGAFIYAAGDTGVVKIDPGTNAVITEYPFKQLFGSGTNLKVDENGLVWGGCRGSGWFFVNPYLDEIFEFSEKSGNPKFIHPFNGKMVGGYEAAPWLDILEAK